MSLRSPHRLIAVLVAAALLGACGGSDDEGSEDPTTTEAEAEETTTTTEAEEEEEETTTTASGEDGELGDVCALLDPADLQDVTGLPFEDQQPGEASCTYISSTGAAISLNVADVRGAVEAGLAGAQSTCEDGSVVEIEVTDADGAFTCLVTGIPTVVAAGGDGYLVVLTGDDADEEIPDETITQALIEVLENAIAIG